MDIKKSGLKEVYGVVYNKRRTWLDDDGGDNWDVVVGTIFSVETTRKYG